MRTGEIAKILGIDRATIYKWIAHPQLKQFFSREARGEGGTTQRLLMESDAAVLNTIRGLRTSGNSDWGEIARMLEEGYRITEFPQNAITSDSRVIPLAQARQAAEIVAMKGERDTALQQLSDLRSQLYQVQQELFSLRKEYEGKFEAKIEDWYEKQQIRLEELRDKYDTRYETKIEELREKHRKEVEQLLEEIARLRSQGRP